MSTIDLTSIKLLKSSCCLEHLRKDTFGYRFKYDNPSMEFETEDIILYCVDRENNLIEGLVHELTEMTIKKLLIELLNNDSRIFNHIYTEGILFRVYHLATVLSLPYYGVQLEFIEVYENMLKDRRSKEYNKIEV